MATSATTAPNDCGRDFEADRVGSSRAKTGFARALTLSGGQVEISHQADSSINQHRFTGASVCVRSAIVW